MAAAAREPNHCTASRLLLLHVLSTVAGTDGYVSRHATTTFWEHASGSSRDVLSHLDVLRDSRSYGTQLLQTLILTPLGSTARMHTSRSFLLDGTSFQQGYNSDNSYLVTGFLHETRPLSELLYSFSPRPHGRIPNYDRLRDRKASKQPSNQPAMDVTEMNGEEPRKSPATATTYTAGAPPVAMQAGEAGFPMPLDATSCRGRASASEPGCGFCPTASPRRV